MWLDKIRNQSIQTTIAHATAFKRRGFYGAAKHLLNVKLEQYPNHEALLALYQQIELLQQLKIKEQDPNRYHNCL
jgi:hypothetical protein